MLEETPSCIPWPACPHSLILKDTIKRTSWASRRGVHEPLTPFVRGDIDGPSPQRWSRPGSSSSIRPMDCWGALCPDPFFGQREK
jgi:hypothetical protein